MALNSAGGGSVKSIYPKGPEFTLQNFSNKDFIVRDFVEELAESAIPINRRSGGGGPGAAQQAFDPKPLIRTFEGALNNLVNLSEDLEETERRIANSVGRAEGEHERTLDDLGKKLDQSISSFEALDLSLNAPNLINSRTGREDQGGIVAVQIGERLEDLDRQRTRANDAKFLIRCWLEVSQDGRLGSLEEKIRLSGGENKVRCAVIARQLMRMSQRLDPASWAQTNGSKTNGYANGDASEYGHNTREIIEKFSESLELLLLDEFDISYRNQNYDAMRECATVLYDFNGGASVVQAFVGQHDIFINRDILTADEVTTDTKTWEELADPDMDPPGVEPSLQSLIDEIRVAIQNEAFIIKKAFSFHEVVLITFIQRIFQQSVQQRLERVLQRAEEVSSLAFLRSLHASRSYINNLIEELKAHGLTEHPEPCSAQTALSLDQQLDELFVPYLVGNSYIDRERKSLEELYSSLLFKFTIYHSRRKKTPTGFMASLAQQGTQLLSSAKDAYIDRLDSSELTVTQKTMMLRVAGLRDTEKNKNEIEVSDEDGVLSIPNAKRMLKWLAEGVRRTLELGSGSDTPKDVSALLNLLLTSMGQVYIETSLDAAVDLALVQKDSKTEPDLAYLPALRPAITITSIMSRFINTVLIRLAESNTTVRRSMEIQVKGSLERIEEKMDNIMKSTLIVVVNWVSRSLNANQKKVDFRPRDNDVDDRYLTSLSTSTCASICTFLTRIYGLAGQAIDGYNLESFTSTLSLSIRDILFEHFKKFQVNATGGLMVTKDISKYISTLKDWNLSKDAQAGVEVLSEIGNLFIIGPEALKERSRLFQPGGTASGVGKKLGKADFRQFVLKREDATSVGITSVLNGL